MSDADTKAIWDKLDSMDKRMRAVERWQFLTMGGLAVVMYLVTLFS